MVRINRKEIHGNTLGYKPEGVSRLLFQSFDGMAPWKYRNKKIVQGNKLARRVETDITVDKNQGPSRGKLGMIVN